jgi:dynein heavy chain 1
MRHDLKAENNVFFLDPPLEHAKFCWMQEFHRTIGIICSLPRLEADQYSLSLGNKEKRGDENYENVLFKIDEKIIQKAYDQIFKVFKDAEEYLKNWYNYESLWSIDSKKIYEKLGDDISLWQKLLNEIRENRKTFDNSQTEKYFGPIIVNYSFVLTRISTKYDFWHNEIINHFGSKFGDTLKSFFANCQNARGKLEKINFTNISADIVDMVNEFQIIKKKNLEWTKEVEKFDSSAKLLERQRYKYPTDWLEIDKVMQEWGSFKQIFKRKTEQLDNEIPRLQDKVRSDERQINEKIR